jgi:two-component system response regulator AlgR
MLRVLIVDDEPPARGRLRRMLANVPDCELAGEAASANEALAALDAEAIDVLLLDISMPGLDGMALARKLAQEERPPSVVFCTAWPDQALEAFECDAVDYLVKPIRAERLSSALEKVARMRGAGMAEEEQAFLRSTIAGKTTLIPVDSAICLLAEDKYTTVIYAEGQTVINDALVDLEQRYPDRFLRVHRSALVATSRIRGLESAPGGPAHVILDGTDFRPEVSRRLLAGVRRFIRDLT